MATKTNPRMVTIKYRGGAYATNTVRGHRASSTSSAAIAASRLGRMLLGDDYAGVQEVIDPSLPTSTYRWQLLSNTDALQETTV